VITTIDITCDRKEYEEGTGKIIEEFAYARVIATDLDVGTHIIAKRTILNRLTAAEFVAGTVNRSLYPQIELMREQNDQVFVVIEGNAMSTRAFIESEAVVDALAWLAVKSGVQTVLSASIEQSAKLIASMAQLCQAGIPYPIQLRHATPLAGSSVLTRYILEGLPGVSTTAAGVLAKRFGSVHGLAQASLEEIQSTPGIGYMLGKKVYHAMRIGTPQPQEADQSAQHASESLLGAPLGSR